MARRRRAFDRSLSDEPTLDLDAMLAELGYVAVPYEAPKPYSEDKTTRSEAQST